MKRYYYCSLVKEMVINSGVLEVTEDGLLEVKSESWVMMKTTAMMNKNQRMKAVSKRMKVKSKNLMIQCKKTNLMMIIKKRRKLIKKMNLKMIWIESDEDKGMDDTTDQFDDDVDARLEEPTQTGKEVVQGEGADVEMIDAQQGNENLETTQEQVVEDAHVTISTVTTVDEVQHEVPNTQTTTLLPIPVSVITTIPQSLQTFTPPPLVSTPIPPPTTKATNPPTTLPDFASVFRFNDRITALEKERDAKDKDKDEDPFAGSDRGLKKRKLSKDAEPTTGPKKKDSTSGSSKGTKSQPKSSGKSVQSEEPVFEVADSDLPQDQEGNLGPAFRLLKGTRSNYVELEYDFEECYKALSEKLDWENPEGGDYPFDLSKPLPLITRGNRIEDMVLNIWSPVKVTYDRYTLWGISHWREQRKSFYAYARGIQSRGDVYSTKRILAVTHVKVVRKHGYGYLEEIIVRSADNNQLINLLGDDVVDFAIALRMFTRSLVIQKQVEDLQLRVESYQNKINVTKPDTTRLDLKKGTRTLHTNTLKDSFMLTTTRGTVLAEEKMEQFGKEKSSFNYQGHQQAAKGKKDDEEFGEIRWR
ncbi:hypothetical protein Tco_0938259 [Tanacetum coccineum]|uniref:Uncharacterized protein n=1 Tax=Tanacetum coccineum TaxID=301880 RepID=A0ABQ5DNL5_9ASTR